MVTEIDTNKINYFRGYPIFSLSWAKYLGSKKRNITTILVLSIPILLSMLLLLNPFIYWTSFTLSYQIISLTYTFYIAFGVMIVLFFATYVTSDEISDKTISYLLHSPISREELGFWKLLAFLSFSIVLFWALEAVFFFVFSFPHLNVVNGDNFTVFIGLYEITAINILLYGSFFFLVSVATDKPIVYGLIVGFADQILAGTIFPNLAGAYSFSYHIKAITEDILNNSQGIPFIFTPFMKVQDSYIVIFGLIIVFNLLTMFILRRKEFN